MAAARRAPRGVLLPGAALFAVACAAAAPQAGAPSPATPPALAREVRLVMGTTAELAAGGLADPVPALDAGFAALALVDERMSLWRDSELARLNRTGDAVPSPELLAVLRRALELAAASEGAFDPTLEPLLRAEGHYSGARREVGSEERLGLLARVGSRHVRLDPNGGRVRLDPGSALDLGGIAKGYASDLALDALRRAGASSGLVDLGSSSLGSFGVPLEVELRDPERRGAAPWGRFVLDGGHASTSGGDQQPGHILDPRSGQPARGLLAVTVVASSGMEADALSTAAFVLGPDSGLALVARRGAAGVALLREAGRRVLRATPGFTAAHGLQPAPGVVLREGPDAAPAAAAREGRHRP